MMPETLLDGLTFPEGPRWHQNRLWFSDFYNHRVVAVGLDGRRFQTIIGLGFLVIVLFSPDGVIGLWRRWSARAHSGRNGR